MKTLSPKDFLNRANHYLTELKKMRSMSVDVGIPEGNAEVYETGATVLQVGATHEFGAGRVPERSFLRVPFDIKRERVNARLKTEYQAILDKGQTTENALGRIGLDARNIVLEAFDTGGFGQWEDISQATKDAKGSSGILKDTGLLRGSITWEVKPHAIS